MKNVCGSSRLEQNVHWTCEY